MTPTSHNYHKPMHGGFVLNEPNIQVFERKPKEAKPEAAITHAVVAGGSL